MSEIEFHDSANKVRASESRMKRLLRRKNPIVCPLKNKLKTLWPSVSISVATHGCSPVAVWTQCHFCKFWIMPSGLFTFGLFSWHQFHLRLHNYISWHQIPSEVVFCGSSSFNRIQFFSLSSKSTWELFSSIIWNLPLAGWLSSKLGPQ